MNIVICGSMLFSKEMVNMASELRQWGNEVIIPHDADKYANGTLKRESNSESTENKIKNTDAILVANFRKNNIDNYIGGNSFLEMGFAHVLDKKIYLYNEIPDMPYTDEIMAMQPTIINQDLNKINL